MTTDDFTRRLGLEFEQLVGDDQVHVDADAVAAKGARTLRRRRNLTAVAVAAGVVVLVAGGTFLKLPSAPDDRLGHSGSVPVCAPGPASSPYTVTVPLSDAPVWFTPEKNRQLDQVATAALPAAIRGDGLAFHNLFGAIEWNYSGSNAPMSIATAAPMSIATASVPTVSATAALHSEKASATLVVTLRSGPAGRPACSAGPITSRTIGGDGTVVDIGPVSTSSFGWTAYAPLEGSSAGTAAPGTPSVETRMNGSANTDSIQVVAYRPDGSVLTVTLTDALGHVMTEAQLVDLATAPGLDVTSLAHGVPSSGPTG